MYRPFSNIFTNCRQLYAICSDCSIWYFRLGCIWRSFGGLALAGIVFQIFFYNRFRVIGTICYLVMGWLAVTIVNPLLNTLSVEAIWWLVAGGVLYSIGAIFYLVRKIPYNHVYFGIVFCDF